MAVSNVDIRASVVVEIRYVGGQLAYNVDNSPTWDDVSYNTQMTIINESSPTSILPVLFTTDITITDQGQFFLCGTNDIQFGSRTLRSDGTRPIITIEGVDKYPGLVTNANGCSNISICNLQISTPGSTLANAAGWVGQFNFAKAPATNNFIMNCFSDGTISGSSGGIVGAYAAENGGTLTIIGCQTTGQIEVNNAGGIIGKYAAYNGGTIHVEQCFSSGNMIGFDLGGIFGSDAGVGNIDAGTTRAVNCYSTGSIGVACGGIYGINAGNTAAEACYSTGVITDKAGGIYGAAAGTSNKLTRAINCYTTGNIQGSMSGGIYGVGYTANIVATNCYTSGPRNGINAGGIFSNSLNDNLFSSIDNVSEGNAGSSGWNTAHADSALTGTPSGPTIVGNIWTNYAINLVNKPYELRMMGYSPYDLTNIQINYDLIDNYSQTIVAGSSTISSPMTGISYAYSILEINGAFPSSTPSITIDTADGTISTTTATSPGLYKIIVRDEVNPYNTTLFYLTILGLPPAPTVISGIPECCQPNVCTMNPQETNYNTSVITQKKGGKAVDKSVTDFYAGVATGQRTAHSQPIFKSYHDYMTYLQGKYK